MNLCDYNTLRALLSRHGFHFSRTMGQNFLIDPRIPAGIADASGAGPGWGVLEIGPGAGCLTRELSARAERVAAVELDRSLLPVLAETMADAENFQLINEDILKLDIPAAADRYFSGLTPLVCANLPYNITTPALRVLVEADRFETITVMVQKEVAQRITAPAGAGDYGAFSVYMQYHTEPELLFDVPPDCFLPRPKVTSAVVRCRTRTAPPVAPACGKDFFFQTVRAAFALRRKTLRNSLSSVFGGQLDREQIAGVIEDCGFPPTVRGETLGMEEFAALADRLYGAIRQ